MTPDIDIQALIRSASKRSLRPGETAALSAAVSKLESDNESLRASLDRLSAAHRGAISSAEISIGLSADGSLLLRFPEQHSVRISVGLLQADNALAMQALLRVLRERAVAIPHTVGSPGAPTQYDMREILKHLRTQDAKRVAPARKSPAPAGISLADLDLD